MKEEKKKSSTGIPLIIIVLVLAGVVGGAYYLYRDAKNQPKPGSPTPVANNATKPPANAPIGANPPNMLGSPTASVTVEEFADFQCPSCAVAHPVMKEIQGAYAGNSKVRFIFRHLPLSIHDKAMDAAAGVEAAGMQGQPKFWAMMDQLLNNQQAWANAPNYKEIWRGYAEKIGLDVTRWENDASGMGTRGRIELDMARANAIGVRSTPTVYINNKPVAFADVNVATMRQLIDAEIASAAAATAPAANAPAANAPAANTNSNK